jgi:hypothetical protein
MHGPFSGSWFLYYDDNLCPIRNISQLITQACTGATIIARRNWPHTYRITWLAQDCGRGFVKIVAMNRWTTAKGIRTISGCICSVDG